MNRLIALFLLVAAVTTGHARTLDDAETTDLLARISERRTALGAMEVRFTERRESPLLREPSVSRGTLALHPDGRFRRTVDGQSVMVNDGSTLWVHYPEFNEVEKYSLEARGPAGELVGVLTDGMRLSDVTRRFRVSATEIDGGYELTLIPRSARLRRHVRELRVRINRDLQPVALAWAGGDSETTQVNLTGERSIPADSDLFQFSPPPDARVSTPLG